MASSEKIRIPQKPPMVMVDRIISSEERVTVTSFLIRGDNVFCDNGFFREPGIIENIAQSAAAGIGATALNTDKEPEPGFIGAIRDLRIYKLPKTGDEITTRITVTHEIFNATVVNSTTMLGFEVIAVCELRIFLEQKPS